MKKNGFTIVELLTVVVLIGLISVLVMPKLLEVFERKKQDVSEVAKEQLFLATSQYIELNPNEEKECITIRELIDKGQLIEPVIDVSTNITISDTAAIKIKKNNNTYEYEYSENGCN